MTQTKTNNLLSFRRISWATRKQQNPSFLDFFVILLILSFSIQDLPLGGRRGNGPPSVVGLVVGVHAFHHNSCTRSVQSNFQFPNCYIPEMETSQYLSSVSFVMSHNAATGYITTNSLSSAGLSWWYSKNQIGSAYQQLDDGARALDLRPKLLLNQTVIFQHGDIDIMVSFQQVLQDIVRWCQDNPTELVLLLTTEYAYQKQSNNNNNNDNTNDQQQEQVTLPQAMNQVYQSFGVPYVSCGDVYGLTVGETMNLAALSNGGYLLALDGQDYYGSSCAKKNWVSNQLVTCYLEEDTTQRRQQRQQQQQQQQTTNDIDNDRSLGYTSPKTKTCISSQEPWKALQSYMLASANNEPTDDSHTLGPPSDLSTHPFNEIQALWQVDGSSAAAGMKHLSSILDDTRKSKLNMKLVDMIYNQEFNAVSMMAIDNVAFHGNAILSVLRNQCGQSSLVDMCGSEISKPPMTYINLRSIGLLSVGILYVAALGWILYMLLWTQQDPPHPKRVWYTFVSNCQRRIPWRKNNKNTRKQSYPTTISQDELIHDDTANNNIYDVTIY